MQQGTYLQSINFMVLYKGVKEVREGRPYIGLPFFRLINNPNRTYSVIRWVFPD